VETYSVENVGKLKAHEVLLFEVLLSALSILGSIFAMAKRAAFL